jgi:hypothetical protein
LSRRRGSNDGAGCKIKTVVNRIENFGGYLTSEAYNPAFGFGIMGRFLNRAVELHVVRKDNFPNLLSFTQDLAKATAKFTKVLDCNGIRNRSETFPQWVWNMLFGED